MAKVVRRPAAKIASSHGLRIAASSFKNLWERGEKFDPFPFLIKTFRGTDWGHATFFVDDSNRLVVRVEAARRRDKLFELTLKLLNGKKHDEPFHFFIE
ncbi:MAG TPA: hypothetical protein VFT87_02365 [Candidatus Saccharimonadales bacterium]|nr:hypothetical protein [Candidatus Saccharimonadales bacterium]